MAGNLEAAFAVIDELVEEERVKEGIPGIAVGITDRNGLLHVLTSGYSEIQCKKPVTRETPFHIGSISKSFAGVVALQLVEEGKLDLHVPVKDYLPWLDVQSSFGPMTLHHLLTHTGGIATGTEIGYDALGEAALLTRSRATAEPGTYFHYSNVGYKIVGLVIEKVLGEPIADVVKQRVLKPLGMDSSEAILSQAIRERTGEGHCRLQDDRPRSRKSKYVPAPWQESSTADGSISSTAGDMTAYIRMILNRGRGPKGEILSQSSFSLLTQKAIRYDESSTAEYYGYGLVSSEVDGHQIISHSGGMLGFVSNMLVDMTAGVGIIVLYNCGSYDERSDIAKGILRIVADAVAGKEVHRPQVSDLTEVRNATEYAGTYSSGDGQVTFIASGGSLFLEGISDPLEQRGDDAFYVDVPGHNLFYYRFERKDGEVVGVSHGAYWFAGESYKGPLAFEVPPEWESLTGHYRTHDPWISSFRIVVRKDKLLMIDATGGENVLVPLEGNLFRIDTDPRSPERIEFDLMVESKATRATISGCGCFRVSTP